MLEILNKISEFTPAFSAIIAMIGIIIAVGTFVKAVYEYRNNNKIKLFEKFTELEKSFREDSIYNICMLLENDSIDLIKVDVIDLYKFLGFYEEVALMYNSKLISKNVAYYMFGYFAIKCIESKNFWNTLNKKSLYWSLFISFANEKKGLQNCCQNNFNVKRIRI